MIEALTRLLSGHSATDDFNHGVVLSSRPLRSNEVFQVRIDKMVDKWAGSIEIGVTTHNPAYLQLPSTMTNLRSGRAEKHFHPEAELLQFIQLVRS